MGYVDVSHQAVTFLLSVILGCVLCLIYDIFRVIHKLYINGFFEVLVTDLLFFGFSAFITYCFLILRCQGYFRVFVLVGQCIGFVIVRYTISKFFILVLSAILGLISKVLNKIITKFYQLATKFEKIIKNLINKLKKHLKQGVILLYNQLKVKSFKNKS